MGMPQGGGGQLFWQGGTSAYDGSVEPSPFLFGVIYLRWWGKIKPPFLWLPPFFFGAIPLSASFSHP